MSETLHTSSTPLHVFGPKGKKLVDAEKGPALSDVAFMQFEWSQFTRAENARDTAAGTPLRRFLHNMERAAAAWSEAAQSANHDGKHQASVFFMGIRDILLPAADFRSERLTRYGDDIHQLVAAALMHVPRAYLREAPHHAGARAGATTAPTA